MLRLSATADEDEENTHQPPTALRDPHQPLATTTIPTHASTGAALQRCNSTRQKHTKQAHTQTYTQTGTCV